MKKIITLFLLMASATSWAQTISITIDKSSANQQKLSGFDLENYLIQNLITYKIDTLKAKNGKITIPNTTKIITPFALARMQPRQALVFYVEPKKNFSLGVVEPNLAIKSSSGSKPQSDYISFLRKQENFQKQSQLIQKNMASSKNKDSLRERTTYYQMQMNAQYIEFINEQKDNNLGAYMIFDIANKNQRMGAKDLKGLYNRLSEKGKATHFGKQVGNRMNRLTAMDVGNMAPTFTLKDANGKNHSLESLRGKYVLLDFWASWCGPCVKEIPHLKKAYEEYHKKGFEIMSVSIDRKKSQWLKAVDKYKMPWISVIDNAKNEEKITQTLYYVPSIPRTVLLDTKGKVIGKDYRGAALEQQLSKIFKN